MRISDQKTIEQAVPSLVLMNRAAMGVYLATHWHGKIVIAVGSGNNGGDGFALACILKENGIDSRIVTLSDSLSPDSAYYAKKAEHLGISRSGFVSGTFADCDMIADCLLGTGFHGNVREPYATAIREINASRASVISVDINSGMNGDTGEAETAVYSDLTVTIGYVKKGFLSANAPLYLKRLVCADIGILLDHEENKICSEDEWKDEYEGRYDRCPPYLDMRPIDVKAITEIG